MNAGNADAGLAGRVEEWLAAQMPIIRTHGGTSAVREADPETGRVVVELGGTCSGCAISGRTAQRLKVDLADEFDGVTDVVVRTGDDGSADWDVERAESYMGIDRNEGGRGGRGESSANGNDVHF